MSFSTRYSLGFYKLLKLDDISAAQGAYKAIADTIFRMRYLQVDLYIPFALNILRHHSSGELIDKQLEEVFYLIETYFSRRVVCSINTTSVDRFLASLHKDVLGHLKRDPESNYVEVLKYIFLNRTGSTSMPTDSEYENAIRTNETYRQRNSFINYILTASDSGSKESKTLHDIARRQTEVVNRACYATDLNEYGVD